MNFWSVLNHHSNGEFLSKTCILEAHLVFIIYLYYIFQVVRRYILEFISPISLPHGIHLLGAIAVAWNDRRKKTPVKLNKKVFYAISSRASSLFSEQYVLIIFK